MSSFNKNVAKITLKSANSKEEITLDITKLLYINSDGNYASFFLKLSKSIEELYLRKQLIVLEDEFKHYKNIVRCHKSYIINTDYVCNVTGNARGYFLHFKEFDYQIPVSRKFKKKDLLRILHL